MSKNTEIERAAIRAETQALEYKIGNLREILRQVKQAKKTQAESIRTIRNQISQMQSDVVGAAKGTNVGAKECREALESAIKKLDKAESILRNL